MLKHERLLKDKLKLMAVIITVKVAWLVDNFASTKEYNSKAKFIVIEVLLKRFASCTVVGVEDFTSQTKLLGGNDLGDTIQQTAEVNLVEGIICSPMEALSQVIEALPDLEASLLQDLDFLAFVNLASMVNVVVIIIKAFDPKATNDA